MLSKETLWEEGWKGSCVRVWKCMHTDWRRERVSMCDLDIHPPSMGLSSQMSLYGSMMGERVRLTRETVSLRSGQRKACWTHNDIENKQWWMGTWSPCNHRALNGKSLSSGAQPCSTTTGRPRRQGVKVHLLCVCVWVCALRVCIVDQLYICA